MPLDILVDAYDSVANVDSYWADRGNTDWTSSDNEDKEVNIRKATDYLDREFRFVGRRKTQEQRLSWPRVNARDTDGFLVGDDDSEAPRLVREACAIVADIFRQGGVDLEGIVTTDAAVIRQKVDVIEVQYDDSSLVRGAAVLSHVIQLLRPITVSGNRLMRA